jgi:hypothetical protein
MVVFAFFDSGDDFTFVASAVIASSCVLPLDGMVLVAVIFSLDKWDSIHFSQSAPEANLYDRAVETGFQVPSEFSIGPIGDTYGHTQNKI